MTDQELDNYVDLLKKEGWKVELMDSGGISLNESFSRRYLRIPEGYVKFLQVASCVNAAETVWFLYADDYNGTSRWHGRGTSWRSSILKERKPTSRRQRKSSSFGTIIFPSCIPSVEITLIWPFE
jgi:hypothetical protein